MGRSERKPEHIGQNIKACHEKEDSKRLIDEMLQQLNTGKKSEVGYSSVRYGRSIDVKLVPWDLDGRRIGYIQRIVVTS